MNNKSKTTEELIDELWCFTILKLQSGLNSRGSWRADASTNEMSDNPEIITGATGKPPKRRGTLTITVGLPCSGKSTWGEELRKAYPDRVRIVNRDDIRAANGTRYEDGDEQYVAMVRDYMIDRLLILGYDVICTDTNLSPKVQRRLEQIAKTRKAEVIITPFLHVSLDLCLSRNSIRWAEGNTKVPDEAIIRMYEEFIKPKEGNNAS